MLKAATCSELRAAMCGRTLTIHGLKGIGFTSAAERVAVHMSPRYRRLANFRMMRRKRGSSTKRTASAGGYHLIWRWRFSGQRLC